MPDPNANYHFYNDWGCGYSGELVFNNPEFTQIRFKAVIEPYPRASGDLDQPAGATRIVYELEGRRPGGLRTPGRRQHPLETGATR